MATRGPNVAKGLSRVAIDAPLLTFIIPVRHPANSDDWDEQTRRLSQTIRSIDAQTDPRWRAIIVANREAMLPPLPAQFMRVDVDFEPNALLAAAGDDRERLWEAVRIDKGRRLLAGLVASRPAGFVMIVDDDDFVSRSLVAFVAQHPTANGWYVCTGYVWGDGGSFVYRYDDFSRLCGTSHIIRADLYAMPADVAGASERYVQRMLGSHIYIAQDLSDAGTPLAPLPFNGAIYRIGHRGSVSRSASIRRQFFPRTLLREPRTIVARATRLRILSPSIRREFFGT